MSTVGLNHRYFTRNFVIPAAAAFAPTDIAGCVLWIDPSDTATITQSSNAVSQINDKSGGGFHLVQATGANQPLTATNTMNGLNVLKYDGSNDTMTSSSDPLSSASAGTAFWVMKSSVSGDLGAAVSFGDDYSTFAGDTYETFGTTVRRNYTHGLTLTNANQFTLVAAGNDRRAYDNGVNKYTNTSSILAFATKFNVAGHPAGAGLWSGDMAEIIFYSAALNDTDRGTVEAYLKAKWGTP